MMNLDRRADFGGQRLLFDPPKFGHPITLVGLGGAGSAILWALVKMGVMDITGYDPDKVEEHNAPAQLLYSMNDVGTLKAEAAAAFLRTHVIDERQRFRSVAQYVDSQHPVLFSGVVISALDSMDARRELWRLIHPHEDDKRDNPARYEHALACEAEVPLYVDCRMGARLIQIQSVVPGDPESMRRYESWLDFDDPTDDSLYGQRTFIGSPMILAGFVADQLAAFYRGEEFWRFAELDLETRTFSVS